MAKKKFELFITHNGEQFSFELGQKPLMFGSTSTCDLVLGNDEPKIKAIIQKQDEQLLVKIFDNKYPVLLNGKKYKSAKIKNSIFFKIGEVDIVVSIEEVVQADTANIPLDTAEEEVLEDYEQEDTSPALPVPTLPSNELPVEVAPEIIRKAPESMPAQQLPVEKPQSNPVETVQSPVVSVEPVLNLEPRFNHQGEFEFNINFDETKFEPFLMSKYIDTDYDYSHYIDTKDETIKELPVEAIEETKGQCFKVIHMNNGVVLSEEHFSPKRKKIFISKTISNEKYFQVVDCKFKRSELIFIRDKKVYVCQQDGYTMQKVNKLGKVVAKETPTVTLVNDERIILTNGTSQIIVKIVPTPPRLKPVSVFDLNEKLVKTMATVWAFVLIPLLTVIIAVDVPKEKEKIKKELVIIYKRKKVKKVQKKVAEPSAQAAKADVPKEKPAVKKAIMQPKQQIKKPVKKVVQKRKPVKVKAAKVKPIKKVKTKIAKTKKARLVSKKVSKTKKSRIKAAPTKSYSFKSASKMNSMLGSKNSKMRTVKKSGRIDMSSAMGSSTAITKNFDSKKFGKSNMKIGRFAAGSRSGSRKGVGTRGLSGKRGASTSYIEANTKILGALDPELIRKIMREYIPQFRYCYQKELMKNPSVAGVFDLGFQINARGIGRNVKVHSRGKGFSSKGKKCLRRVVKLIKFPKPKGGGLVDVKQPMNFYKQ